MILQFLILSLMAQAQDGTGNACLEAHKKAQVACSAHEHAVSAEALTIVSENTRSRVISAEKVKLDGIFQACKKHQESCALICDEAVETATLDGEDVAVPLENLSDCRQGSIVKHLQAMNRKREQLSKIQSLKSDKGRAISNVGMK